MTSYEKGYRLMRIIILLCFVLVIACSGRVHAAGDGGLFIPSAEESSSGNQNNRWKTERKSSYRPSPSKRSGATANRNDETAAAGTEKERTVASADDSLQPWTIALLALGGLTVASASVFLAIRVRQARTAGHYSRERLSTPAFLAASLVQTEMHSGETPHTMHPDENKARRAA